MRYVIHPGDILSKNDRDIHFISAGQLMDLYGLDPKQCVVFQDHTRYEPDDIHLYPRFDGDYREEKLRLDSLNLV
jgi:hypothetical protein